MADKKNAKLAFASATCYFDGRRSKLPNFFCRLRQLCGLWGSNKETALAVFGCELGSLQN